MEFVCVLFFAVQMNRENNQASVKYAPFVFNLKIERDSKKRSCKKSCIDCLHFNAATTFQWANKIVYLFFPLQHTFYCSSMRSFAP